MMRAVTRFQDDLLTQAEAACLLAISVVDATLFPAGPGGIRAATPGGRWGWMDYGEASPLGLAFHEAGLRREDILLLLAALVTHGLIHIEAPRAWQPPGRPLRVRLRPCGRAYAAILKPGSG